MNIYIYIYIPNLCFQIWTCTSQKYDPYAIAIWSRSLISSQFQYNRAHTGYRESVGPLLGPEYSYIQLPILEHISYARSVPNGCAETSKERRDLSPLKKQPRKSMYQCISDGSVNFVFTSSIPEAFLRWTSNLTVETRQITGRPKHLICSYLIMGRYPHYSSKCARSGPSARRAAMEALILLL